MEFIVNNRRQALTEAIRAHYVDVVDIPDDGFDTMYFLDQQEVVHEPYKKWGGQNDMVTPNDIFRALEIISMEKNHAHTTAVLNFTTEDSETLDNPSYKPMLYFGQVAMDFNTLSLLFEPPTNKHKIEGHKELSANDYKRVDILRSSVWIKKTWDIGFKDYGKYNKLYKEGTGGGERCNRKLL